MENGDFAYIVYASFLLSLNLRFIFYEDEKKEYKRKNIKMYV